MSDQNQRLDAGREDVSTPGETLDLSLDNTLSIRQAAASADVTEKTIRRWIQAGRLRAMKLGGQYQIAPADLASAQGDRPAPRGTPAQDAGLDTGLDTRHVYPDQRIDTGHTHSGPRVDTGLDTGQIPSAVDLRPLVNHIASLEGQVRQLTEAATVWQVRAVQAEERLKQLTAGDNGPADAASAAQKPRHEAAPVEAPVEAPWDTSRSWWASWWHRLTGG